MHRVVPSPARAAHLVAIGLFALTTSCKSAAPPPSSSAAEAPREPPLDTAADATTPEPTPRKTPQTAQDCRDLVSEIVNDPPPAGSVAMNNATAPSEGPPSDRLMPIMERVAQHRDQFRCCFDLWAKDHPGQESKVALTLELLPDGKLRKAAFKTEETDLKDAGVETCMVGVANAMTFPESPSGKETTYTHRFVFKSRAR